MLKRKRLYTLLLTILFLLSMPVYASADEAAEEVSSPPARVQEVTNLRATNSDTYLLNDGTYECVVYAEDKYYYDDSSSLQLIDNSIVPNSAATSTSNAYKNAANGFDVFFSSSGTPQISLSSDECSLTFSPILNSGDEHISADATATLMSIGQVENCDTLEMLTYTGENTVTYSDVYRDTDFAYVLENDALKEYIILESSNAPNEFAFTFVLEGLTLQTVDGTHHFVNEAGDSVFSLAPLFAIDANGEHTEAVTYEITPVPKANLTVVNVVLDEEYLSDPERAFPVVIDPSILITGAYNTYDTYVSSRYNSQNYYLNMYLRTGKDEDFHVRRTYIQFDLPYSINPNDVTSAYVGLKVYSGSTPNLTAYMITRPWNRSTITWNNAPLHSLTDYSSTSTVSSDNWCRTYVTSIVQQWLGGFAYNYGLMIKDTNESSTSHWTTFYSSDSGYPNRPELRIYYTPQQVNYSYIIIKNSNSNENLETFKSCVNSASSMIDSYFNVSFTFNYYGQSSELNYDTECTYLENSHCEAICGDVSNCRILHHKASHRFLDVFSAGSNKVIRYVDYAMCDYDNSKHIGVNGTARIGGKNVIISKYSDNILRTTCHELSHLIGAWDNVCTSGQPCVMNSKTNVTNLWCSQCSMDILDFLEGERNT